MKVSVTVEIQPERLEPDGLPECLHKVITSESDGWRPFNEAAAVRQAFEQIEETLPRPKETE